LPEQKNLGKSVRRVFTDRSVDIMISDEMGYPYTYRNHFLLEAFLLDQGVIRGELEIMQPAPAICKMST
jgi:hypothetical protein